LSATIDRLLDNNRRWAEGRRAADPDFFPRLARQQNPDYLWIGCADSRVPANEIVGLDPGELFVHRNVANVVVHSDVNALSVLQYAVDVLGVEHIIVCGHYGCGGVAAALQTRRNGIVDLWLRHIRDVYAVHKDELDIIEDRKTLVDRVCELNVAAQVRNVCHSAVVQGAWHRGKSLAVHGWIYGLADGHVRDLGVSRSRLEHVDPVFRYEF
jgi:carbonic anhydrase